MVLCFLPDPNIHKGPGLLIDILLILLHYGHYRDHMYNEIKDNITVHVVQNIHWANPDQTAPSGEGLAVFTLFIETFLS